MAWDPTACGRTLKHSRSQIGTLMRTCLLTFTPSDFHQITSRAETSLGIRKYGKSVIITASIVLKVRANFRSKHSYHSPAITAHFPSNDQEPYTSKILLNMNNASVLLYPILSRSFGFAHTSLKIYLSPHHMRSPLTRDETG
jgi:hypothetical protein